MNDLNQETESIFTQFNGGSGIFSQFAPWFYKPFMPLIVTPQINDVSDLETICEPLSEVESVKTSTVSLSEIPNFHYTADEDAHAEEIDDKEPPLSLHNDPSALRWAKEFAKYNSSIDEEIMVSWFANAMMAMHDHVHDAYNKREVNNNWVYVLSNAQVPNVIALYSEAPSQDRVNRDYALSIGEDMEMLNLWLPVEGQGAEWNCILTRCKVDSVNRKSEKIDFKTLKWEE
jgi:hypothetical protein